MTCDPTFATSPLSLSGFGIGPHDISVGPVATAFAPVGSSGDTRYFTVAVQLPSGADNSFQGRKATLSLTWEEDQ